MMKINSIIFTIAFIFIQLFTIAQQDEKVRFSGLTRSLISRDLNKTDTINPLNSTSGYSLIDLNTHINPLKDIEILAQLRIRNEFGSFFGSGTQITVRQLTAKGVLGNRIKFTIGDMYLKQNKFTLHNYDEELPFFNSDFVSSYRDIVHYENFYTDNRWRLQGIQTNFSYEFDRFIKTLEFDFFITRPRGYQYISNANRVSDMLLSGGSLISKINSNLTFESNYINLFEIPSSGNINISVRNPVIQGGLNYHYDSPQAKLEHNIQAGFSERSWLQFDSLTNYTVGMFSEFSSSYTKKDSSLGFSFGGRYVDPNFRSSGSQTRRINFNDNTPSVYPEYTSNELQRPISVFDIISDPTIYNQDLSTNLMGFNPIYSNSLPFGDATPNRLGVFAKFNLISKNKFLELNFNSSYFEEVIGQGSLLKRNFVLLSGNTKFNLHEIFGLNKKLSVSVSIVDETTKRSSSNAENVNLISRQLNFSSSIETLDDLFIQLGYKSFNSEGNEYLTNRSAYGNIQGFTLINYNQNDNMYIAGLKYKFRPNVYLNLQYNLWGTNFNDSNIPDFKYQRLLFIFSVKL
ncbi:MAG: hypothetical protein ISQ95_02830 [Flavobacteriales bacterium]|nr:hypothetical protein [Flavobacteriales bacterium]